MVFFLSCLRRSFYFSMGYLSLKYTSMAIPEEEEEMLDSHCGREKDGGGGSGRGDAFRNVAAEAWPSFLAQKPGQLDPASHKTDTQGDHQTSATPPPTTNGELIWSRVAWVCHLCRP